MKKMLLGIALVLFADCIASFAMLDALYFYLALVIAIAGLAFCLKGYREMRYKWKRLKQEVEYVALLRVDFNHNSDHECRFMVKRKRSKVLSLCKSFPDCVNNVCFVQ